MMLYEMRKQGPVNIVGYYDTVGEWKPILQTAAITKRGSRIKLAKYVLREDGKKKAKENPYHVWPY